MTLKFHHNGYVSADPRCQPAEGTGLQRPGEIPDEVDVLIVGAGPADGSHKRSVETFQAFGFAEQIAQESSEVSETTFWKPDPENPGHIRRASRVSEKLGGSGSEFPHLNVNPARVLDYFAEYMQRAPTRMVVDYGVEFVDLERQDTRTAPRRGRA